VNGGRGAATELGEEHVRVAQNSTGLLRLAVSTEPCPGRQADRLRAGQLSIPVRPIRLAAPDPGPRPRSAEVPPEPDHAQLRTLLAALLEVVTGRRSVASLRGKVSVDLLSRLRRWRGLDVGARFLVRRVHIRRTGTDVVEMCATVHLPARGRAVAVTGLLRASWHGWTVTDFDVIQPQAGRRQATVA